MKTRTGFVANSSSSSFVLPKDTLTMEQVIDILEVFADLYNKVGSNIGCYQNWADVVEEDGTVKILSTYDNSIPHAVQEFLEGELIADRSFDG